jgi:hypothetical protein
MLYVIIMVFVILAKTPCIVAIVLDWRHQAHAEMEYAKVMKSSHALTIVHLGAIMIRPRRLTVGMESVKMAKRFLALMIAVYSPQPLNVVMGSVKGVRRVLALMIAL